MRVVVVSSSILMALLIGACQIFQHEIGPQPTTTPAQSVDPSETFSIHTDRSHYLAESINLVIVNHMSAHVTIPSPSYDKGRVGEGTFQFFRKTRLGWERLRPFIGMLGIPMEGDSGAGWTVAENSQLTLNIDYTFNAYIGTLGVPLTGTFMIRLRYLDDSQAERFQYSNEFVVGATAPENRANTLVTVARLPSSAFQLQNESERTVWLTTMCNSLPTQYREDDHTVLQHRTAEGTWKIVPYVCEASTTPLEVEHGQSVTINDSWWGRNLGRSLVAGSYRWDLVFYLYVDHDHEPPVLRDVRHVFTDPFEYGQ